MHLLVVFWLFSICIANTETYLFKIPQYYDIVPHASPITIKDKFTRHFQQLNDTHRLLLDYPIQTIDKTDISNLIKLQYNTVDQPSQTLLIRVNNYNNSMFQNEDLLNIKLCWPATSPYDFDISHGYLHSNELSEDLEDNFEMYVVINYQFHGHTYDESRYLHKEGEEVEFQLYINKLPNKYLPIPLELYDVIMYLVDMTIFISWNVLPWIVNKYFP